MTKTKFEKAIWSSIAARLAEIRGDQSVDEFLRVHKLQGLKWRIIEDGRQGISVESLIKICNALNVAPTWLLFGIAPKELHSAPKSLNEVEQILVDFTIGVPREQRRAIKQALYNIVERVYAEHQKNVKADVSSSGPGATKKDSGEPIRNDSERGEGGDAKDKRRTNGN